jgi:hypothetical protein
MRVFHVGTTSFVLSLAALLTACAGGPSGPGGRGGPFAPPPPPRPSLFISPFGEPFMAEPGRPYPSADWFAGADADQDGAVTFAEFEADGRRFFATLDADRDGRLNQDELAAYEASLRRLGGQGMGGGRPGGPGGRPGGAPEGGMGPGGMGPGGAANLAEVDTSTLGVAPQTSGRGGYIRRGPGGRGGYGTVAESGFFNLPQPVKSADVNIDQRVSAEEWAAATQRWFYSLDTDRDGKLTLATLPVTPAQAAAARR